VSVAVSAAYRAEGKQADLIKAIDDFVSIHQTKSAKPTSKQTERISK
jgi:hypothetical protein